MSEQAALTALTALTDVAVVAIGRNEGDRLRRCIESAQGRAALVVYVDSGSTDGSLSMAASQGAEVVALDMRQPFTAARARNAGAARALDLRPDLVFLQFVDGDCEIDGAWLVTARDFLRRNQGVAVTFGRRRERHPERSIFNQLCDIEWNVAPGPARYCGGDVMMRAQAWQRVGGYREDLIAGEEPELCLRLHGAGWTIHCLDAPMTLHDAAITRWSQWWKRSTRSGHAFAEGADRFGAPPQRHWVAESRRAVRWGLLLPAVVLLLALFATPWWLVLLAIYPAQMLRLYLRASGTTRERAVRALLITLGYFPEAVGHLRYWRNRLLSRRGGLIEYK